MILNAPISSRIESSLRTGREHSTVSIPKDHAHQRLRVVLDAYAALVRKSTDARLITLYREHLKLHDYDLAKITSTELERRVLRLE